MPSPVAVSRLPVGSSARMIAGLPMSARAIAVEAAVPAPVPSEPPDAQPGAQGTMDQAVPGG